jgi:hypothetical protein
MQTAKTLANFSLLFLASLAPLMFLVGMIVLVDRWGTHNRFLRSLEAYGKTAEARVSYTDEEYNRAGVDFVDSAGNEKYGTLDFRYYSPEVVQTIQPGKTMRVIYIDKLISENEKTALAEHYDDVKNASPVTADVWWMLGISWLVVALRPHFVFLGVTDTTVLISASLVTPAK